MFCIARNPYIITQRHDCGRMNVACRHCGALHWMDERVSSSKQSPEFSMCCLHGQVSLPLLPDPPDPLRELYTTQSTQAREFRNNIVLYNRALTFTSLGVSQDHEINDGFGPPTFRIHGELKHWSGSLLPQEGHSPSYAQLYIYDPKSAMQYRMNRNIGLRRDTMQLLQQLLLDNNGYASIYQHAFEILNLFDSPDYSIRLCAAPNKYSGHNNLPTVDEVAVIVPGTSNPKDSRDIILSQRPTLIDEHNDEKHYRNLQRISDGHPAYAPLHYVLLFPYGEPGWHWDLKLTTGKRLTLHQYCAFRLHDRANEFSTILHGGQLLQHYMVDMFAAIDQN